MLIGLSVPSEHERGPQYAAAAFAAVHQTFRGRTRWELILAKHGLHVGLFSRVDPKVAPVVNGQLLAAYPDLRIERLKENDFEPPSDNALYSLRLRLSPSLGRLFDAEHFIDREQCQLADPLAALLGAIASGKTRSLRPTISVVVRRVGRMRRLWLRYKAYRRGETGSTSKTKELLWSADIRLSVASPRAKKFEAVAKLHELAGVFAQYLPPGRDDWRFECFFAGFCAC